MNSIIIFIIFLLLINLNYFCLGVTDSEELADIKEKLPFHEKKAPPGSLITIQCDTSHTGELEQLIWLRNDSKKSVIFKKGQFMNVSIFFVVTSQPASICSKLTIETLEQDVKYVQS